MREYNNQSFFKINQGNRWNFSLSFKVLQKYRHAFLMEIKTYQLIQYEEHPKIHNLFTIFVKSNDWQSSKLPVISVIGKLVERYGDNQPSNTNPASTQAASRLKQHL